MSDHFPKVKRSSDRTRCKCFGNFDEKYKVVSSANKEIDDLILSELSLIYKEKKGSKDRALEYTTICIAYFRGASIAMYHLRFVFQIRSY